MLKDFRMFVMAPIMTINVIHVLLRQYICDAMIPFFLPKTILKYPVLNLSPQSFLVIFCEISQL